LGGGGIDREAQQHRQGGPFQLLSHDHSTHPSNRKKDSLFRCKLPPQAKQRRPTVKSFRMQAARQLFEP
jgi:hypothetical protein